MRTSGFSLIKPIALLCLVFGIIACASKPPKPVFDYNPDYDFSLIKTYAFSPGESIGSNALVGGRVEQAIVDEMERMGIKLVEPKDADTLVRFMVITQSKQDVRSYTSNYRGGAYRCWRCSDFANRTTEVQVINYTEGTLVIDMIDPKSNHDVWHAISRGKVSKSKTPEEREEKVRQVVGNMFAGFPPL
jgi:DNA gyrase/topoisomerase IV subunit A